MKFTLEPKARVWIVRVGSLNVCIGAMGTMVLSLTGLCLPPTLVGTWIAYVGVVIGCLMSIPVYRVWGSASCLADMNVFGLASLTAFGSGAIHSIVCSMLSDRDSAGLVTNALNSCAPHNSRAIALGGTLAVFGAAFIVWVAVRYLTWAKGRH